MDPKKFRRAKVQFNHTLAGFLSEIPNGYRFVYESNFIRSGQSISASLPLREAPYEARELFSFFRGLLPEGWYLDIVSTTAKIDQNDLFGLLLATTSDTIGAVSIHEADA
jgi:serine/threonine-protein kinase HipA